MLDEIHYEEAVFYVMGGHWPEEAIYVFNLLIYVIYFLAAVFLSYWIFRHLIRFPVFNSFFSLTTLTHYYRRYHQPETKLKQLAKANRKKSNEQI